jgi:hypothetical protein
MTIAVVIGIIYLLIRSAVEEYQIQTDNVLTVGIVTGVSSNWRKTGGGVKFSFVANGKSYSGSTGYSNLSIEFCESLIGKSFPVIYASKNVNNSEMLLTSQMFKQYDLQQPDSLKWIDDYTR